VILLGKGRLPIRTSAAESCVIPCAELLGHAYGKTLSEALHHAHYHPQQPVHRAEGSQRVNAQRLAHNSGVHNGI